MKRECFWATAGLFASVLLACGSDHAELCELADKCENGNEQDLEACESQLDERAEIAEVYGCEKEWEDLYQCALDNNDCEDDQFTIEEKCDDEHEDYKDCID